MSSRSPLTLTNTPNYSLLSIPVVYALAFPPAIYSFATAMRASNYTATNIVPRTNLEAFRGKVDARTWSTIARAYGAHLNALEAFPLFAAAMIVGNYASLPPSTLNTCAVEYIASHIVYTVLYLSVKSEAASYLRSTAYFFNIGVPFWVLWKAGSKLVETM